MRASSSITVSQRVATRGVEADAGQSASAAGRRPKSVSRRRFALMEPLTRIMTLGSNGFHEPGQDSGVVAVRMAHKRLAPSYAQVNVYEYVCWELFTSIRRRIDVSEGGVLRHHDPLGVDRVDQHSHAALPRGDQLVDPVRQCGSVHPGQVVIAPVPGQDDVGARDLARRVPRSAPCSSAACRPRRRMPARHPHRRPRAVRVLSPAMDRRRAPRHAGCGGGQCGQRLTRRGDHEHRRAAA